MAGEQVPSLIKKGLRPLWEDISTGRRAILPRVPQTEHPSDDSRPPMGATL